MLTELIPLALVIALSPLSIIPAVLVLHTPRPRPTGLAFLLGWLVALAILTAIFVEGSGPGGGRPPGAGVRGLRRTSPRATDPAQGLDGTPARRPGRGNPDRDRHPGAVQGNTRTALIGPRAATDFRGAARGPSPHLTYTSTA